MATGWQEIDGNKYFMHANGYALTGWHQINDSWFYFNDEGVMQTATLEIDGTEYTFEEDGRCVNPPEKCIGQECKT